MRMHSKSQMMEQNFEAYAAEAKMATIKWDHKGGESGERIR